MGINKIPLPGEIQRIIDLGDDQLGTEIAKLDAPAKAALFADIRSIVSVAMETVGLNMPGKIEKLSRGETVVTTADEINEDTLADVLGGKDTFDRLGNLVTLLKQE